MLVAAAVVGAGAFMGYGFVKLREGRDATVTAPAGETEPAPDLVAQARQARTALDTAALERLAPELAGAQAPDARREQVAVLAALALESSVRAAVSGDAEATAQVSRYVNQARPLVDRLEPELDPGFALATRARLDLASGEDVLARHPAVLHPGFHDHELQHALLAEPLWRPKADELALDAPARESLARALETTAEPTTFERLLLALALPDQRARSVAREVLDAAPSHPLAQAVLTRLEAAPTVAVADPGPIDDPQPAEPTEPQPAEPTEPQPAEPIEPQPAEPIEPQPAEPQPAEPRPSDSGQTKKPPQPKPPKPKPATDLAEEGCKLVHGGKAEQGFTMLQRAFDQNPRDTKVILCMAEGHMKLGRLPSARALVERVVRNSGSKNKKALQLAAKIEDQLGNKRSAADYYRKLLELDPDNATAKAYVEKHG